MSHNKMMSAKKLNALQEQLKQIHFEMYKHEQILKSPSEYSMIVKICEKYDLSENIEELINHYLQKTKFKESLKIFNQLPKSWTRARVLYDLKLIKNIHHHRCSFYNIFVGGVVYNPEVDYHLERINILGLKLHPYDRVISKRRYTKDDIKERLIENDIKFLQSDNFNSLVLRLLEKHPKPVKSKK